MLNLSAPDAASSTTPNDEDDGSASHRNFFSSKQPPKNFTLNLFYISDGSASHLNLFSSKQPPKKKRKSRTAFNNHQLFELEKRFLYQKYLSPADRDELSQTLGLSNAQVITWFQNRRAKLKRDMEELKKDVHTATLLSDHTVFIKTMTQMGLLKNRPPDQLINFSKK
ncbi:hypothetical protein HAZT_HAZT011739 [Hyalella azteca]|uniref:Homeobox domain-containing protein n=1 Tax=Hyalella azteca TaxID=294128 RepID=A0A6A0GY99_HYAAZ|nr:hypothetical protein HAZT_HAZT011739 [Hyalella azteca]